MSFLSDAGNGLIKTLTGQDPAQLQANLDVAQQQVTIAIETMITLQAIMVFELFLIAVIVWKERRG